VGCRQYARVLQERISWSTNSSNKNTILVIISLIIISLIIINLINLISSFIVVTSVSYRIFYQLHSPTKLGVLGIFLSRHERYEITVI
jgi:hypothetical protein